MKERTKGKNQLHFPVAVEFNVTENLTEKHSRALVQLISELQQLEKLNSKHDVERVDTLIEKILQYLPGPATPEKLRGLDYSIYIDWHAFASNEYSSLLDAVINLFDTNWPVQAIDGNFQVNRNILRLFTIDENAEFSIECCSKIFSAKYEKKFITMAQILEKCLQSDTWIFSALVNLSTTKQDSDFIDTSQDEFLKLLLSIPNRVANQLKGKTADVFIPKNYSSLLMLEVLKAIHFIVEVNAEEKTSLYNTTVLSQLLSRILIDFNFSRTSEAIPNVFDVIYEWASDEKYKIPIQTILLNLQRNAVDIASFYILQKQDVARLIGDAIITSNVWKFCLLTKLPLLTYLNNETIITNLTQYLASKTELQEDLYRLLTDLLQAWSSKASINNQTVDQHLYITKLIISGVELFNIRKTENNAAEFRKIMFNGVQNHLESMNSTTRLIGMYTAEIVTNKFINFEMKPEDELHFEYDNFSDEDKAILIQLKDFSTKISSPERSEKIIDVDGIIKNLQQNINNDSGYNQSIYQMPTNSIEIAGLSKSNASISIISDLTSHETDHLDSDDDEDDLKPYDMSNDIALKSEKVPRYLIDLKEALVETDDPDVFESSMNTCSDLIQEKLPNDDVSVGLELLQLLIGLEKKFYMENFENKRLAGCVAICTTYPKQCAEYICREFHTEIGRYSISRKLLMLDILCETSRSLSTVRANKVEEQREFPTTAKAPKKLILMKNDTSKIEEARRIIRKRIEEKTRRFNSHPRYLQTEHEQTNRFSDVAGYFFFPLIYGFGKQKFTDFKSDLDNVLLIKFLHTLATVTLSAQNCPIAVKFASEIFQLSSVFRFHPEPPVRLAVLQMIASVFMVIPKNLLAMHNHNYLAETRAWLDEYLSFNIVKGEKNAECRELAKHVLVLCIDALVS